MVFFGGPRLPCVMAAVLLSLGQATTLQPDPPINCDACKEWNAPHEPFRIFGNALRRSRRYVKRS